jgi:small subunit ribosomal protein S1
LVKEDGSQAQVEEKLEFKVIEFNKDAKRIILSHSRIHEDIQRQDKNEAAGGETKKAPKKAKKETAPASVMEKTTLGDIQSLADLKDQLDNASAEEPAKKTVKKDKKEEATESAAE